MDKFVGSVRDFDRFTLDLRRGCVRMCGEHIDLRPKTFEVLSYLAANVGRLVPKQELLDVVWPNIAVSDDSLVQCIRELRNKLGDQDHSLIKTVPRRGYILDAEPASPGRPALKAAHSSGLRQPLHWIGAHFGAQGRTRQISIVAVALVFLALSVGYILTSFTAPGRSELFMPADAHRVAAVADSKGLPLPPFEIVKSDRAVSAEARGFVGIWVSDKGWVNSNRQVMLIITQVAGASAAGYIVHGPPQPRSAYQSPPHFHAFKAIVAGKSLSFDSLSGKYMASFADNGIELRLDFREGGLGVAALDPLWTLSGAEKVAARERARDD